jgi:L-ascorbate metabolism protein UlaG (beta-lactamase superfamily)
LSEDVAQGYQFDYPEISGVSVDLLLITHEHVDHWGAEKIDRAETIIRSTAGRFDSALGEVVAVASDHDKFAGTVRGFNTIFVFSLDGARICHLGDFGQELLRPEQRAAIGEVDVLFVPVGGDPTINPEAAASLVESLGPSVVFPMHYRTKAINWLEPPDAFLDAVDGSVLHVQGAEVTIDELLENREPRSVVMFEPPFQSS